MTIRMMTSTLLLGAVLATAGCANSVINDPEEMARRHADIARSQAAWNGFWGGFSGSPGQTSSAPAGGSSAPSVGTYEPRRCYQTSNTQQTCFD